MEQEESPMGTSNFPWDPHDALQWYAVESSFFGSSFVGPLSRGHVPGSMKQPYADANPCLCC